MTEPFNETYYLAREREHIRAAQASANADTASAHLELAAAFRRLADQVQTSSAATPATSQAMLLPE